MKFYGANFVAADSEILERLILPSAFVQIDDSKKKPFVILTESSEPDSLVKIDALPEDTLVIHIEKLNQTSKMFTENNHARSCADYIVMSEEKKTVIYVEIKKSKDDRAHVTRQLTGAECLFKYIKSIGKKFWRKPDFLEGYKHVYVGIMHTGQVRKRPTRHITQGEFGHDPASFIKITSPGWLSFNKLASTRG